MMVMGFPLHAATLTCTYSLNDLALDQTRKPGSEQLFKRINDLLFIWRSQDKDYLS